MAGTELLTLQFVSAVSSSATVLLDLNNRAPLFVAADGWNATPPQKQVTAFRSSSRDGANVAQESYDDRELNIKLGINAATQDEAAEKIQALGRLLNSPQWLRFKPNTIEPVYFRCHPGEIESIEEFNGQEAGTRIVNIRIPAEPFAYGLPVSGAATIANDPTAATNPMSYVFPAIQGDVATPLCLAFPAANLDVQSAAVATQSGASIPLTPVYLDSSVLSTRTGLNYSWSVASDSEAIGGSTRRFTTSGTVPSAVGGTNELYATSALSGIAPGDYRVFVRMRTQAAGATTWKYTLWGEGAGETFSNEVTFTRAGSVSHPFAWVDSGVRRLPFMAPPVDRAFGFTEPAASISFGMNITSTPSGEVLDIDGVLLVPVGLDIADASTYTGLFLDGAMDSVTVNGITQTSAAVRTVGSGGGRGHLAISGTGVPTVSPATKNLMHVVWCVYPSGIPDLTTATVVNWSYYPRYLYIRPATT